MRLRDFIGFAILLLPACSIMRSPSNNTVQENQGVAAWSTFVDEHIYEGAPEADVRRAMEGKYVGLGVVYLGGSGNYELVFILDGEWELSVLFGWNSCVVAVPVLARIRNWSQTEDGTFKLL